MPRKKQQNPKRLVKLQKLRLKIEDLVYLVYLLALSENNHILISKSRPRQLLFILLHKDIEQSHPMLNNTYQRIEDITMKMEAWEELIKNTINYTVDY